MRTLKENMPPESVVAAPAWVPDKPTVTPCNPLPPSVTVPEIVTCARVIVKVAVPDVPPAGVGLNTVTAAVPQFSTSAALIAAVSWLPPTYVVARAFPFQRTLLPGKKFVPLTVNVNPLDPERTEV